MAEEAQVVGDNGVVGDNEVVGGSGDRSGDPLDFKMPPAEDILAALEKMTGLTEESKQQIRDGILARQKFGEQAEEFLPPAGEVAAKSTSFEFILLLSLISVVFLVLVLISGSSAFSFIRMNRIKALNSAKKLINLVSVHKPNFKEMLLRKIESRIEEERVKVICTIVFILWTAIFLLAFVFFGYKLYKSLVERERRREEKKRQKLQKKKK